MTASEGIPIQCEPVSLGEFWTDKNGLRCKSDAPDLSQEDVKHFISDCVKEHPYFIQNNSCQMFAQDLVERIYCERIVKQTDSTRKFIAVGSNLFGVTVGVCKLSISAS